MIVATSMDTSAIHEQAERILRSRSFASKSQLKKLLQILFERMDSEEEMTSEHVIRELWPNEIRTKRAADVATEMNRLRRALKDYYEEEGAGDAVTIVLPKRAGAVDGAREHAWIEAIPRAGTSTDQNAASVSQDNARWRKLATIAAVVVLVAVGAYLSVRALRANGQPRFGRMDGSVLRIMDAEGKELWSKSFPEGFGPDWYYEKGLESRIWFADLEGKGHNSVLFSYSPAGGPQPQSSTLICYSDRGKEKWRWNPGRDLPELAGSPATYKTYAVGILKATEKRPARIAVESQHFPWWPTQIALVDAQGKTVSEYWHSGGLGSMVLADLDGDGRQEIIAAGASEYDHQATLVVLDPERVYGASKEVRPGFQIQGMGEAQERLRLLFPRSDLNRALFQFNEAMDVTVENGVVRLTVAECITPMGCRIWYEFDKNFRLIAAYAGGDEFRSAHARFYQSGKDAHSLDEKEMAAFQKVRCLVGCESEYVGVGKLVP